MIRLAVCDDEIGLLTQVDQLISNYNQNRTSEGKVIVSTFLSPKTLLANVEDGDTYDVYLLDIEMPDMDGLTLARAIKKIQEQAVIVFLTSHSSMAFTVETVKLGVTRYVSKLDMEESLPEALDISIQKVEDQMSKYLLVTHYHDITRVAYQDIMYAHRVKRLTEIVLKAERTVTDGRSLSAVYKALDDLRFVYIEQGCFVNLDFITRVTGSEVFLKNGEKLAITLQRLHNKGFIEDGDFREQSDALASQRKKLTDQRTQAIHGSKALETLDKLRKLQDTLATLPEIPWEFDIGLFDQIVEKIVPISNTELLFKLKCGLELKEVLPK